MSGRTERRVLAVALAFNGTSSIERPRVRVRSMLDGVYEDLSQQTRTALS